MTAYYNENDPKAAAWLRELIKQGHIAPGVVDERSIVEVVPDDIRGFTQCHFFAGIGVWSRALRLAGWDDSRPVWTGSCPCQPFSAAGKGAALDDERHLWPAWEHLIRECRPAVVFGEQVASKAADAWADLVQDDLEALGYAFGAVPFPAASVGAPHIRDRLYWVADSDDAGRVEHTERDGQAQRGIEARAHGDDAGGRSELGDASGARSRRDAGAVLGTKARAEWFLRRQLDLPLTAGAVGDTGSAGLQERVGDGRIQSGALGAQPGEAAVGAGDDRGPCRELRVVEDAELPESARFRQHGGTRLREQEAEGSAGPGSRSGQWGDVDWLWCLDQKYRPVESGTFPLADGAPERVGRLRGYGNAIVAPQAQVWIETYLEARG